MKYLDEEYRIFFNDDRIGYFFCRNTNHISPAYPRKNIEIDENNDQGKNEINGAKLSPSQLIQPNEILTETLNTANEKYT